MEVNMETPETSPQAQPPCRHLRSKEMYYQATDDSSFASGACWCLKTQEAFGPDGQPAGKAECCAGRSCYSGI